MDLSVITTYRCDSRCSMCYIWQNPTRPVDEITATDLERLPGGFDNVNITGGEPTLRKDLPDLVDVLQPKAKVLEISSNGLHAAALLPIVRRFPATKIRFSAEGIGATSDRIRGEKDGYARKVEGLLALKEAGGKDLGFAITIQDENVQDLLQLYALCREHGFELATSALHNGFQFHKADNVPYDRVRVARSIERLIEEMLRTSSIKNWFRAYLNLGLIEKILGHDRLIPCTAARDFAFIDPWGDVYACNVRPDLLMGTIRTQAWAEIMEGPKAREIRRKVASCQQNCWMVTTARTAMRQRRFTALPKPGPAWWVALNLARVRLGGRVPFDRYIDYGSVRADASAAERVSFLSIDAKRKLQILGAPHYQAEYFNR